MKTRLIQITVMVFLAFAAKAEDHFGDYATVSRGSIFNEVY